MGKLDNTLAFIKKTWPDLYASLSPVRIQGWKDEAAGGDGRSEDEIRQDIFKYVVTEGRVQEYVQQEFDQRRLGAQDSARISRITNELMTSKRTFDELGKTLDTFVTDPQVVDDSSFVHTNTDGSPTEVPTSTPGSRVTDAEKQAQVGIGGGGPGDVPLTILTGEEMKWFFDSSTGKWYVEYGLPESDRSVVFEVEPDQMDSLFGRDKRPTNYTQKTFDKIIAGGSTYSGNVGEMEGTGSFESEVKRVQALALDDGKLPEWANADGEIMDLVYIAQAESKSDDWLLTQIAKTQAFTDRFPGLDKFKSEANLTLAEAVTGYIEFERGLTASIKAIGGNEAAVTPAVVGGLLDKGYNLKTTSAAVAKFGRMKDFAPAMQAFNKILVDQGYDPITDLQDMFDFVGGTAPAELYDVWEASSMAEAASAAGLGDVFTAQDAMNYAISTEGSTDLGAAQQGFQTAAQMLLRMRHQVDVGQFGIDQEDIIDMALGQPLRSGLSVAELSSNMNRAVQGAQKDLKGRLKPYKNYTQDGAQVDLSVGRLRSAQ